VEAPPRPSSQAIHHWWICNPRTEKHLQQEYVKVTHTSIKENLTERIWVISHKMEPKDSGHKAQASV
jgi:P2-related tail formation protein